MADRPGRGKIVFQVGDDENNIHPTLCEAAPPLTLLQKK